MISVREAKNIISSIKLNIGVKQVDINTLSGFVLAEDLFADRDYPPFNRATMDGFAINSNSYNCGAKYRVVAEIPAGYYYDKTINNGSCVKIMTGAPVPEGLDAVIKLEDSEEFSQGADNLLVSFRPESVKPYLNIAKRGEDILKNMALLRKGDFCSPQITGALATAGITKIRVMKPPSVAIISTGSEIVSADSTPLPFQIRDSNIYTLCEFLKKYNIIPEIIERIPDHRDKLAVSVKNALDKDILILTGGVSMGSHDFVPSVMLSLNVKNIFHKVAIKPGKPIWFGQIESGAAIFALPGNPFSVQITYKVFVENFIRKAMGLPDISPLILQMESQRNKKNNNLDEYFPATIVNDTVSVIRPMKNNGSGDIKAGLNSDGIGLHPLALTVLEKGEATEFIYW